MPIQNLSLAAIINESQQGEQAARRAVPTQRGLPEFNLAPPNPQKSQQSKASTAGQEAVIEDQQRAEQELEAKKKAMEAANQQQSSTADLIQMPQQVAYLDTFLKIFGIG